MVGLKVSEHEQLAAQREKHPDWIWNRSDNHVILGVPGTLDGLKTVVEPGNCFSPGPGTFGVSAWLYDPADRRLYAPETMPLEAFSWRFLDARLPVLVCAWNAGPLHLTSRLFTAREEETGALRAYLTLIAENPGHAPAQATLYLVVRSFGAAGGPIRQLALGADGLTVEINGLPQVRIDQPPTGFGAVSYVQTNQDIGEYLQHGRLPETQAVTDDSTWASGALAYALDLAPGQTATREFVVTVRAAGRLGEALPPPARPLAVARREADFRAVWRKKIDFELDLPDPRVAEAMYAQLLHLYMGTVHDSPRICPISYPLFWLRDGAYALAALDRGGIHEFVAAAGRQAMSRDTFGGFGAEGDGPGQLIWFLSEHYLLTRDEAYLAEVYPHLCRQADLIIRMRHTKAPLYQHVEFVTPVHGLGADNDLLCRPAANGLIQGRMDYGIRPYWCSAWGWLGLTRVVRLAQIRGDVAAASRFAAEADELLAALKAQTPACFGRDERDLNSAFWPTGWASADDPGVRRAYDEYWAKVRYRDGQHQPTPLWTYFEAGQAHNYLLLGEREKAWISIEHFLSRQIAPGLYTYHEGRDDENSFGLWQRTRGWDRIKYVTPHGWTGAELFLLLRDCLVREEGETLVIGAGVPSAWLEAGRPFGVRNLPTHFGRVSWRYDPHTRQTTIETERPPAGGTRLALPA